MGEGCGQEHPDPGASSAALRLMWEVRGSLSFRAWGASAPSASADGEDMETGMGTHISRGQAQGWEHTLGGGGVGFRQVGRVLGEGEQPRQDPRSGLGNDEFRLLRSLQRLDRGLPWALVKEGTGAVDGLNPREVYTHQFSAPVREAKPSRFSNISWHLLCSGPRLSPGNTKMVRNRSALKILTVCGGAKYKCSLTH